MVCDKVIYGGQVLITIYHQGFDDEIKERRLEKVQKIGSRNLIFTEALISDDEINNVSGWILKEEGLLAPGSAKNPYHEGACAYMEHYAYFDKPDKLFRLSENKYMIHISFEKLMLINEFVKKYTGLDIEKNPMLYGDTLIYRSHTLSYRTDKSEGIIIEGLPVGATAIVRFKKKDVIVSTKIVHIDHDTAETEIKSDRPWTYHDIEIYLNGELIYFDNNVSYIGRMQLSMHIMGQAKQIKLNKIADSYAIESQDSEHISHIGDPPDKFEELIDLSNSEIRTRLNAEIPDNQVTFMKPGELNRAMDIIGNVLQSAVDTIWVFDSYFTDSHTIKAALDWLNILANCKAKSKNVVFYSRNPDNAYDLEQLRQEIENDTALGGILRTQKTIGIHFYQTKNPIHDRFVLTNSNDIYAGIAIGTSFKSLGDHYYCIYTLSHKVAHTIWDELKTMLDSGNNVLKYEEV